MAEELQLPVRPGGEPVVVVAVQHDLGGGPDARAGQERAEVGAARDVAPDAVRQLARPVPGHRARQVALLVGRRVDVDLHEADRRIVEMGLRPLGVDEGVGCIAGDAHQRCSCSCLSVSCLPRANVNVFDFFSFLSFDSSSTATVIVPAGLSRP